MTRTRLGNLSDECDGYLRSPHTRYRGHWERFAAQVREAIDALDGPDALTRAGYAALVTDIRAMRLREGLAQAATD